MLCMSIFECECWPTRLHTLIYNSAVLFELSPMVYTLYFSWCQQIRQEEYRYFIYTCNSTARGYTQGALYGYKVVLQLATVLMSIKTRKVKILGMDDYREIILATYISSFVLMIIFIFNIFVADRINLYTIVTCFGLFVGATAIMVLVFVPKVTTNSCLFVCLLYLQLYNRSDQKDLKYHYTNCLYERFRKNLVF